MFGILQICVSLFSFLSLSSISYLPSIYLIFWMIWIEDWTQVSTIRGDFYAQNWDALQPGPVAPWYARYGHTLDAISVNLIVDNREQVVELMVLTGGFAPSAMNDVWATEDGETWL